MLVCARRLNLVLCKVRDVCVLRHLTVLSRSAWRIVTDKLCWGAGLRTRATGHRAGATVLSPLEIAAALTAGLSMSPSLVSHCVISCFLLLFCKLVMFSSKGRVAGHALREYAFLYTASAVCLCHVLR